MKTLFGETGQLLGTDGMLRGETIAKVTRKTGEPLSNLFRWTSSTGIWVLWFWLASKYFLANQRQGGQMLPALARWGADHCFWVGELGKVGWFQRKYLANRTEIKRNPAKPYNGVTFTTPTTTEKEVKKKPTTVEGLGKNLVHHSTPQMLNGPPLNMNGQGISSPSSDEEWIGVRITSPN